MWRWLASVEEYETPVLHQLEDGTGYLCWHHNEGSSSSQLECWCCWRHGGDYQIHGSFMFVPSGCPPHRCPRQHLFEPRLVTYVLYMARTRSLHSHGTFWQRLVISLDPVCEQGQHHQQYWHQRLEQIPISVPQPPSIPSSRICWFGALCHLTPTMEARHDLVFEEDIHITVSGLTRYVHHLQEMHISLQVADFGNGLCRFLSWLIC